MTSASAYLLSLFLIPNAHLFASGARIPTPFTDTAYRIERSWVPEKDTKHLLHQLVHEGVETSIEKMDNEIVRFYGDAGYPYVDEPPKDQFFPILQSFVSHEYHASEESKKQSLVYLLEKLESPTREKNEEMIKQVVDNTILEDGGTIHLYVSAPEMAALDNHTDTTDIVVLQLEGEKEWILCTEKEDSMDSEDPVIRTEVATFDKKLNSCSTYEEFEIDQLDCKRTVLKPGDALFLPRRIVHSARASSDSFSAHLTFGFNEKDMCQDYPLAPSRQLDDCSCDSCCCGGCDRGCTRGCDNGWGSCDEGCPYGCDICYCSCDG